MNEVTEILLALENGSRRASEELLPLVYAELRRLATTKLANEIPGQTLQATALVHEAYLRLVGSANSSSWDSRGHFFSAAAEAMRRILIEQARRKANLKAGGDRQRVEFTQIQPAIEGTESDLLLLNDALDRLAKKDPRKAELVKLRFFAGLGHKEAAEILGISVSTADNDWAYAKSWLRIEMND